MLIPLMRLMSDLRGTTVPELAKALSVDPTRIEETLQRCAEQSGAVVESDGGWQLAYPVEWLDADRIRAGTDERLEIAVSVADETTSTSDDALAILNGSLAMATAEHQLRGRGRQGRPWIDPPGGTAMLTLAARIPEDARIDGLSLAVGAVLLRVLNEHDVALELKWPNDIIADRQKIGGILVEKRGGAVVIGICVNIHMPERTKQRIGAPVVALADLTEATPGRNELVANITCAIANALPQFLGGGFGVFREEWLAHHALREGDPILHRDGSGRQRDGQFVGIGAHGELNVDIGGKRETILSGEIMRP